MSSSSMKIPWTPFTCLPAASLTPSGLLQLDVQDQEVELIRRGPPPLELRWYGGSGEEDEPMASRPKTATGSWKSRHGDLFVTVTTHRLVFQQDMNKNKNKNDNTTKTPNYNNSVTPAARFIHLSNVHQVETTGGPTILHPNASHKVIVSTYTYGDLVLCTCNKSDREVLEQHLQKALQRKQWEMATKLQEQQQATHTMTRRRVGVDHILTKHKLKHQQAQKVAEEALGGDAEQLLQQASALLQVITKYTTLLQQKQEDDKSDDADQQDAEKLSTMLQDMGMTSALTKDHFHRKGSKKKDSDRAYYEWLARQVVDFLWNKLPSKGGGVMSLTDVYCLFNRARGTNLISPEDLRLACDLLDELHLGISQRTFDSGIVVLQMDNKNAASHQGDNDPKEKFHWLSSSGTNNSSNSSTTALEASHVLKVSPLLALEYLKEAEQSGRLCRDTTLETTRFFPNRFQEFYQNLEQ